MPFVKKRIPSSCRPDAGHRLDRARDRPRPTHAARVVGVEERAVDVEHDRVDVVEQAHRRTRSRSPGASTSISRSGRDASPSIRSTTGLRSRVGL